MIHYNVWFTFKDGADQEAELRKIAAFLDGLKGRDLLHDFKLLKGSAPGNTLPPFQAIIMFVDASQFNRPFGEVRALGVHTGEHGAVIANVKSIMGETFEEI